MKWLEFLSRVFRDYADDDAIVWRDEARSYAWLSEQIAAWRQRLVADGVRSGTVVLLDADFSPHAVALFLALMERGCIDRKSVV